MLHMETYVGGAVADWDCGLVPESRMQRDMLRLLRFKFLSKMLLHEQNCHADKMRQLAMEFDKNETNHKLEILCHALKNRQERERD